MNSIIKTYKMSKFCIYVLKHMWESFIGHCLVPYKNHKKLQASKNDHESVNSCVYYTKNFGTQRNKYQKKLTILRRLWLLSIPMLCSLYQWKQITFLYSDNFIQTKMAIIVNGFAIWWYYRNISRNGSGRELELRGDYTGHFVLLKDKIASDKRIGGRMSNIKLI